MLTILKIQQPRKLLNQSIQSPTEQPINLYKQPTQTPTEILINLSKQPTQTPTEQPTKQSNQITQTPTEQATFTILLKARENLYFICYALNLVVSCFDLLCCKEPSSL